jgi:hypothetical protein
MELSMEKEAFKVGDKVAVRGEGLDRDNLRIEKVARVLKSFVELEDGSKFSHTGNPYPRREWSTVHMVRLTPELETLARRQRFVRFLDYGIKWDSLDTETLAEIVGIVRSK